MDQIEPVQGVSVRLVHKPPRKVILKRGMKAEDYFAYCAEVGCNLWELLKIMAAPDGEPVCLWLPERYKLPGTSTYVQGVEVSVDYGGPIPEGMEEIRLPEGDFLAFQGQPFRDADFGEAIGKVQKIMEAYNPQPLGYAWDVESPRIQLEPRGDRGYVELRPVRKIG